MLERIDAALAVFSEEVRRDPAGSALPGIAASNAHLCKGEGYALIAGNGDSTFKRLAVIDRETQGGWPLHRHTLTTTVKKDDIDEH